MFLHHLIDVGFRDNRPATSVKHYFAAIKHRHSWSTVTNVCH